MPNSKYYAVMGMASISTANSNLDGTGAVSSVMTGGSDSTIIKKITVKATQTTSLGMVRIFIERNNMFWLLEEINVSATIQSTSQSAFEYVVFSGITLKNGDSIYAATQNAESFNIIVEGTKIVACPC
jgi:hypothetical protein